MNNNLNMNNVFDMTQIENLKKIKKSALYLVIIFFVLLFLI